MNWEEHVEKLKKGETVSFRPKGNSMEPKISSGNLVTVEPLKGPFKKGEFSVELAENTTFIWSR